MPRQKEGPKGGATPVMIKPFKSRDLLEACKLISGGRGN